MDVPIEDVDAAFGPLIDRSIDALEVALERLQASAGADIERSTVIYQVGGGSGLPAVGRALRERWGRRVWRCPYPHASVAIGLAIAAEEDRSPRITARLTRHFGVWREAEHGTELVFDPIFEKDVPLPAVGCSPLVAVRRYRAAHDIAHFRFSESSRLTPDGGTAGDVWPWREVWFPLTSALCEAPIEQRTVTRLPHAGPEIEERYECDADGVVRVRIRNLDEGYSRSYDLHGEAGDPTSSAG